MTIDNLSKKPLFMALCEALRWWHWFDCGQLAMIDRRGGNLDAEDVTRIGVAYQVVRNVSKAHRAALAKELSELDTTSALTLRERADELADLVQDFQRSHKTKGRVVSGTTKLFWFRNPEGWTLFDSLASAGAGVPSGDSVERMKRFYCRLDTLGFIGKSALLTDLIKRNGLPPIQGERVFDKLLMMRGARHGAASTFACAYARGLPPALQEPLIAVGDRLTDAPDGGLGLEGAR